MSIFQYSEPIIDTFPSVIGGIIVAEGLQNRATPADLVERFNQEQTSVRERIGSTPLSEIPSLAAWRATMRKFGVDPTKYRSACEALLRRLTKKETIPSINLLVDLGNLISIRYGLPVAFVDTATIQGGITVHFSDGTEHYRELDRAEVEHPDVGEVIFSDDSKTVFARRWCWRQSHQSAAHLETQNVLVTIEGLHDQARQDVTSAVDDLSRLLEQYAGGTRTSAILDARQRFV